MRSLLKRKIITLVSRMNNEIAPYLKFDFAIAIYEYNEHFGIYNMESYMIDVINENELTKKMFRHALDTVVNA